jgi:CRP/FNR family transcriptional regulator, cyclic AMP receptor protein
LRGNSYLEHLAEVPLFRACSTKDLKLISRAATEVDVPAGKELVREGAPGHEFFLIVGGKANVTRGKKKVATLGPGEYFGELSLLVREPRNATVTADGPMTVLILGQREFTGVIDEVPGLARKLLTSMAARLRASDVKKSAVH